LDSRIPNKGSREFQKIDSNKNEINNTDINNTDIVISILSKR